MPGPEASNIAHVKMRVLEASKTCQQISNGSDVLEFVMNELTHELGTVTLWGLGGHLEELVPVQ